MNQRQPVGGMGGPPPNQGGAPDDKNNNPTQSRTLWIGDVEPSMNEGHIAAQFNNIATVTNVKLIRDKVKGTPVGYGFVEFADWQTARDVFQTLNGEEIPGTNKRYFKLNWASHGGGVARANNQYSGGAGGGPPPHQMARQNSAGGGYGQTHQPPQSMPGQGGGAGYQQQPQTEGHQVYVGDLDPNVNNINLLQTFQRIYPSCFEAKVICDPITRVSKGYGFIKFGLKEESERALQEMQGKQILGRPIKMNYASQRTRNQGQEAQQNTRGGMGGGGGQYGSHGGMPPMMPPSGPGGHYMGGPPGMPGQPPPSNGMQQYGQNPYGQMNQYGAPSSMNHPGQMSMGQYGMNKGYQQPGSGGYPGQGPSHYGGHPSHNQSAHSMIPGAGMPPIDMGYGQQHQSGYPQNMYNQQQNQYPGQNGQGPKMHQGYGGMNNNQGLNSSGPGSMYNSMPGYGASNQQNGVPPHIASDPLAQLHSQPKQPQLTADNGVNGDNYDPLDGDEEPIVDQLPAQQSLAQGVPLSAAQIPQQASVVPPIKSTAKLILQPVDKAMIEELNRNYAEEMYEKSEFLKVV